MVWRRIKQSQVRLLSNQFQRSYFRIHSPSVAYSAHQNPSPTNLLLNYPILSIGKGQFDFLKNVRFFAAPVQFTQKKEENDTDGPRLNEQITANVVRLVTDEGHCVLPKHEALRQARNLKLDLVEVQRNANPVVCKIMDYHKEKYLQQSKEKEHAKSKEGLKKGPCKEIKFAGKITQKDLQIKADTVKRLMERGYRVKCMASGGKAGGEDSATVLSRFFALIEDISVVESDTRVEEKDQAHLILRHVKYGGLKKGSGKKSSTGIKLASTSSQETESDDDVPFDLNDNLDQVAFDGNTSSAPGVSSEFASTVSEHGFPSTPSNSYEAQNRYMKEPRSRFHPQNPALSNSSEGSQNRYRKDPRNMSQSQNPALSNSSEGSQNRYMEPRDRSQLRDPALSNSSEALQNRYSKDPRGRSQLQIPALPNPSEGSQRVYMKQPPNRLQPHNAMDVSNSGARKAPSFGVFNARPVENAHGRRGLPAEVNNRYKQRKPSDSRQPSHSGLPVVQAHPSQTPKLQYKSEGQATMQR